MLVKSVEPTVGGLHVYLPEKSMKILSPKFYPVRQMIMDDKILFENNSKDKPKPKKVYCYS